MLAGRRPGRRAVVAALAPADRHGDRARRRLRHLVAGARRDPPVRRARRGLHARRHPRAAHLAHRARGARRADLAELRDGDGGGGDVRHGLPVRRVGARRGVAARRRRSVAPGGRRGAGADRARAARRHRPQRLGHRRAGGGRRRRLRRASRAGAPGAALDRGRRARGARRAAPPARRRAPGRGATATRCDRCRASTASTSWRPRCAPPASTSRSTATAAAGAPLPAGVDLSAYRIVQEALTNTLRHAAASHADVTVRSADGQARARHPRRRARRRHRCRRARAAAGRGIAGMRERAAMLGGTLEAGPLPGGGGFRVHARLPLEPRR